MRTYSNLLTIITPQNLEAEEEKFLSSDTYNPMFSYPWMSEEVMEPFDSQNEFLNALFKQDHFEITKQSKKKFETKITEELLEDAKKLTSVKIERAKPIELKVIVEGFRRAMEYLNLDYKIEVSRKSGFYFRPNHVYKKIKISYTARLEFFSVDGAIKHELTHVIRSVNGMKNIIKPHGRYLCTEEGLASFMQDFYGTEGMRSYFQHAAEYVASAIGEKGSLRDIYEFFRGVGFSKKLAWQRAARHKFGFIDCSKPGDIMKPAMYFYHEQKIRNIDQDTLWKLFAGKIPISDARSLPEYTGIVPLEKLQAFFHEQF